MTTRLSRQHSAIAVPEADFPEFATAVAGKSDSGARPIKAHRYRHAS
jgi:hypothetical protein